MPESNRQTLSNPRGWPRAERAPAPRKWDRIGAKPADHSGRDHDELEEPTVMLTHAELSALRRIRTTCTGSESATAGASAEHPTLTIPRTMLDAYAELDRTAHAHRQWNQTRQARKREALRSTTQSPTPRSDAVTRCRQGTEDADSPSTEPAQISDPALSTVWFGPARSTPRGSVRFLESSTEFTVHPRFVAERRSLGRRGLMFAGIVLGAALIVAVSFTVTWLVIQ